MSSLAASRYASVEISNRRRHRPTRVCQSIRAAARSSPPGYEMRYEWYGVTRRAIPGSPRIGVGGAVVRQADRHVGEEEPLPTGSDASEVITGELGGCAGQRAATAFSWCVGLGAWGSCRRGVGR